EREPVRHALTAAETAIWDAMDGERRLGELRKDHDAAVITTLVPRLVHHDVQALKLSAFPMSTYKGRRGLIPPYLTSTMPYQAYDPARDPAPQGPGPEVSPGTYYRHEVLDAAAQFDHQETTLSHLLRQPHPALRGRSYGQAMVDALLERGHLPAAGRVRAIEVGAGLGF